ncbi:MAG: hypothetical protein M3068_12150 [Gemmatimonadota bacterium]|nr:hypothetical protein [Gemmatimonadota bacterium]
MEPEERFFPDDLRADIARGALLRAPFFLRPLPALLRPLLREPAAFLLDPPRPAFLLAAPRRDELFRDAVPRLPDFLREDFLLVAIS